MKPFISKVWQNKSSKQKLVSIPKSSEINDGDYVLIKKVELEDQDAK